MKIIWLASYPKSGNTYLRFLLYNYLYGEVRESIQVERVMPDLHKILSRGGRIHVEKDINIFCKTHFAYSDQHPYIEHTAGAIYILRNPRDLLLSNLRYSKLTSDHVIDESEFVRTFIQNLGVTRWRKENMGTWPENIASWLNATSKHPTLFIKYEDLRLNTMVTFKSVLKFLNLKIDAEKMKSSIKRCSIESMKALEKSEKSENKPTLFDGKKADMMFIGKGKINQSLEFLGDDVEKQFTDRFGKIMGAFGY